jgi:hypothetical protein
MYLSLRVLVITRDYLRYAGLQEFLKYVKERRLPPDLTDVFDSAGCKFHNGVIIIEVVDHRKPTKPDNNNADASEENKETDGETATTDATAPVVKRIEMKPDAQSIWNDICLLNEEGNLNMIESDALNIEAKLLVNTVP